MVVSASLWKLFDIFFAIVRIICVWLSLLWLSESSEKTAFSYHFLMFQLVFGQNNMGMAKMGFATKRAYFPTNWI